MRHTLSSSALWITLALAAPGLAAPVNTGFQLWLDGSDASTIADSSGDHPGDAGFDGTIQTWSDKSGLANHASALNAGDRPTYDAAALNGQSVVGFGATPPASVNTGKAFALTNAIVTNQQESLFFVIQMFDNGNNRGAWLGRAGSVEGFINDEDRYFLATEGNASVMANDAPRFGFQVVTETRRSSDNAWTVFEDEASVGTQTAARPTLTLTHVGTWVGARYFWGQMGEVLVYDRTLNTAERVITDNYLSAKWGTTLAANDRYAGDTAGNVHHDFDVFGIGQDTASTVSPAGTLDSGEGDAISIGELNASLDDGDYLLAGHDATPHGTTTADLPAGVGSRWARDYYLDVTGSLDAQLVFHFDTAGFGPANALDGYTLLYRDTPTGAFTDTGITGLALGTRVYFDLIGLDSGNDGFYTIGERVIPEPATLTLMGLAAAAALRRRGRR